MTDSPPISSPVSPPEIENAEPASPLETERVEASPASKLRKKSSVVVIHPDEGEGGDGSSPLLRSVESSPLDDDERTQEEFEGFEAFVDDDDVTPFFSIALRDKINFAFEGIPPMYTAIDELTPWMTASKWIINTSVLVILLSCVSFMVESLPEFYQQQNSTLFIIESFCISYFTLELLIRFVTTRKKKDFVLLPMNIVDFISVLPYYVDLIVSGTMAESTVSQALTATIILRTLRLVRVIKLSKHSTGMLSIYETIRQSKDALSLLLLSLSLSLMLGSTAIYFSEQTISRWDPNAKVWRINDEEGTVSKFQSIFHAFWYVMTTLTTVGYGDDVVLSPLGKAVTVVIMITGLFVISFPTVILSTNFHAIHNRRLAEIEEIDARRKLLEMETVASNTQEEEVAQLNAWQKITRRSTSALSGLPDDAEPVDINDVLDRSGALEPNRTQAVFGNLMARRATVTMLTKKLNAPLLEYQIKGEPRRGIIIQRSTALYEPLLTLLREPGATTELEDESPTATPESPAIGIGEDTQHNSRAGRPKRKKAEKKEQGELFEVPEEPAATGQFATDAPPFMMSVQANFPVGVVATLILQLHTAATQAAAEETVKQAFPQMAAHLAVEPRKIERLKIHFHSSHPLLSGVRVVTEEFRRPLGQVSLQLFLPNFDSLPNFLRYAANSFLHFEIEYDAPSFSSVKGTHLPVLYRRRNNGADVAHTGTMVANKLKATVRKSVLFSSFKRSLSRSNLSAADPQQLSSSQKPHI